MKSESKNGSVMIFAVLLMSAGVFVLAAVLQLAATQGVSGDAEWAALQRRVTLGNSRSLAREYMLSRIFRGTVPASTSLSNVSYSGAFGGFAIRPGGNATTNSYWLALSTTNANFVLNINPFNLMERYGFYREVFGADLSEGGRTVPWSFALRTRSPVAAGYSFVQHRPADNDLASLATPPYIDMNGTNEQFFGFYGLPRMPLSSVTNTMTRATGDNNGYQGYLDAPSGAYANNVPFADDYPEARPGMQNLVTNPATGVVTTNVIEYRVRLLLGGTKSLPLGSVCTYTVPATTNIPGRNSAIVTEVVLVGTNNPLDPRPLHVVAPATSNVRYLTLESDDNERLLYFYRSKSANNGIPLDVSSTNAGRWLMGLTTSQSDIQFDIGDLEVTGGLRTDGGISFQGGSANFVPETDPGGLDFIADRMMWLEDYRGQ